MNIKGYTTEVPASKSMEYIERLLVSFGATNIMKEYGPDSKCVAMSFAIEVEGMRLPFRLPAKTEKVYRWLKLKKPATRDQTLKDQAERITWKQQHEWVHLQLSMIELEQLETLEAFFPILYDMADRKTYYERVKDGGYKALLPAP